MLDRAELNFAQIDDLCVGYRQAGQGPALVLLHAVRQVTHSRIFDVCPLTKPGQDGMTPQAATICRHSWAQRRQASAHRLQ